ncbi:MAG: hypothetical protein Q9174_001041 [Haloplaca sp. 1 TL-2023]
MDFIRERHSQNHKDSRSDSIDIFYDSIGGTDVIDAWIARLTDEDILDFKESFSGIAVGVASLDISQQQGSLRKRAGNESCEWTPPPNSTSSATALRSEPSSVDEVIQDDAATALPLSTVGPCLEECRSIFSKCTTDFEPIAEDRRRDVSMINCQAAGNCYCAETPWKIGTPHEVDLDKANNICSDTCTSIGQGTQTRQLGIAEYNFEDLRSCLEQAEGGKEQLRLDGHDVVNATFGGLECFRQVFERDPSLLHDHVEQYGNAMQQAISRSDIDLLNFTLQHGADPGRVISDTTSLWSLIFLPVETAVLCSTPEVIRILLHHGATLNDTSALDLAAAVAFKKWNALELVVCLVEEGADINATSREQRFEHGRTAWGPPLQSAIQAQHVPIVRYLLEQGASPGVKDSQGRTAWDQASEVGNEDILRLLATMPHASSA